ncbi:hypothetical protein [Streptomyces sp. NPDC058595]|uniref:hypothetical protein n=1 Tax=Streptomyces sp. NPDC058595 TaxID=3346550 RepID=UPI00365325AD
MNSAPQPRSPRPATAGRPAARAVMLLVLFALLGMPLNPCGTAARGAEPRPAASTPPEPAGEGHHDTAVAAQSVPARAGRRAAGPDAGRDRRPARPPYGGPAAVPPSRSGPVAAPPPRRVVLRC